MFASETIILDPHDRRQVIVRVDEGDVWGWLTAYRRDVDGWVGHVEYRTEQTYRAAYEEATFLRVDPKKLDETFTGTRSIWLRAERVRRPSDDELANWQPGARRVEAIASPTQPKGGVHMS